MKIAFIFHDHGFGGIQQHILLLMGGLRERGHEVIFIGPRDSWMGDRCAERGFPVHHLAMHGMFDIFSHLRFRRFLRDWKPDIIHAHGVRGSKYALAADPARTVCTMHATHPAWKYLKKCSHIIAVSKAVRTTLAAEGCPEARITVIYNAILDAPRGDKATLRKELGIPPQAFAIVNAGRFIYDKGQDVLLQAFPKLPRQAELYYVGDTSTPFGQTIVSHVHDPRIHFLGYRNDLPRILPAFDLYALNSRREACPVGMIEACAAKLPIVASEIGGIPEIIANGKSGILVPPDDSDELASAISLLMRDPAKAAQFGTEARQNFLDKFTLDKMIDATLAVYRKEIA